MSGLAWAAVAAFTITYVLIATERVHRVAAALGGAAVILAIGAGTAETAFFDKDTGIDWDVIFLLLGMMLIVAVLKRTGVFEYLAIWAAQRAKGRPFRVMVLLVLITAVASAVLDNVTTVLLIAPVTFLVCERLKSPPAPFLIAEVLASNIGGTATLVGDPPNIIIASRAGLSYNDFLIHLAPLVVILLAVFVGLCRLMFRAAFTYDPDAAAHIAGLRARDAIRDRRLLVVGLGVLVAVTAGFMAHTVIGVAPSIVALIGGLLLLALSRLDVNSVVKDVEWHTLVFFAGLFVVVGSLVSTGVIDHVSRAATAAVGNEGSGAAMLLLWGSAGLSAIVDNIPYVTTMSPIVAELHGAGPHGNDIVWWALALGADLGGNATAVGASANVVMVGMAQRAGHPIGFWQFTKYGLITTVVTITIAMAYLWLRYIVLS
ncbi:MAG TPA: ArsB/NhaD family transporter [Stackebrandtia sp.]|jgi:Na+/H+ antiporter NhaD/arsenite permease-like protein|uniref:SLC13 family permease n=1 Tax=Stackebrandtia sp. TaxID=2023065 RepID=UPI002D4B00BC|nr:ArsB/NhaD family transporter [Stackebrandtia sp.]HZE38095.1 ArsB/NhaD family transporter [Stackebrandtia sp.]